MAIVGTTGPLWNKGNAGVGGANEGGADEAIRNVGGIILGEECAGIPLVTRGRVLTVTGREVPVGGPDKSGITGSRMSSSELGICSTSWRVLAAGLCPVHSCRGGPSRVGVDTSPHRICLAGEASSNNCVDEEVAESSSAIVSIAKSGTPTVLCCGKIIPSRHPCLRRMQPCFDEATIRMSPRVLEGFVVLLIADGGTQRGQG